MIPVILPQPKSVELTHGVLDVSAGISVPQCGLSETAIRFALGNALNEGGVELSLSVSADLREEEYILTVGKQSISLYSGGAAGIFYGFLTLRQLLLQNENGHIPCLKISDGPDLRVRGLMVDISRNKIPSMQTLYRLVDIVASLKINQLQLYIEGKSFFYPSLKKYYEESDVLTAEDVLALDAYCRDRYVELVPNQNSFGHMSEWLAEEELNRLAECPNGFSFYGIHSPASTLDPGDEGSYLFVKRQLDDLLPLFGSDSVNIGGDEPFELGEGKSRETCERVGRGSVYLAFMKKVFACVKEHGKKPMMWGDVFKEHLQQYRDCFPQDVTILEWGYNADSFTDEICSKYEESGFRYILCPGTSLWNTVTGKTGVMRKNIKSAARLGKKHGAEGILLVDWGDGGTCQPFLCTLLPYATGAAYAWNSYADQDELVEKYLDRFVLKDETGTFARLIADIGSYYLCADQDDDNATKIFKTLYVQQTDCMNLGEGNYEPLFLNRDFNRLSERECLKTLEYLCEIETRFKAVRPEGAEGELYLRELSWAIGYLKHGCRLGAIKAEEKQFKKQELCELRDDLVRLNEEYAEIWKLRNRYTGLDRSMIRMRTLVKKYTAILDE